MNRNYKESPLDGPGSRKLVTVTYSSEPCIQGDRMKQLDLLSTVVNSPGLLDCGLATFEKFTMSHDGTRWVIKLEAKNT